jgi:hypothetical protein
VARNSNRISRGNGTITGRITRQAIKVRIKGKVLKKTTLKFVKGMVVTITTPESATFPRVWLNYTRNLFVSKFKGISLMLTSLLDLLTKVAPKMFLLNTMKMFLRNDNEKIPLQLDDLFSTDDTLVDFQSNDIFVDTN